MAKVREIIKDYIMDIKYKSLFFIMMTILLVTISYTIAIIISYIISTFVCYHLHFYHFPYSPPIQYYQIYQYINWEYLIPIIILFLSIYSIIYINIICPYIYYFFYE